MAMTNLFSRAGLLGAALALMVPPLAGQTIYKCVDAGGGVLISNHRVDKHCKPIVSAPENSVPAPKPLPKAVAAPSPAGFPRVQEETQKVRDNDRRHILEQELLGEQRSLEAARRDLGELEAQRLPPERLQPYRDRVQQHERNVQALQKELGSQR
ncbi:MAG: DUF4124 domain-containing protein [Azonexus sp.]|nr:DUF4124 domain-containing protein [Azonexus sp.]MCK6413861.1 DUF4124 domain-containing protein [Azonexus sp.]